MTGVLCIHGFTGTPFEMRYLGERLAERGYRTVGPMLPGHGTHIEDLDRTTWRDWFGVVEAAYLRLRREHERVAVVGQSLGGLLTLRLAQHPQHGRDIAAIASLAAPLWLPRLSRLAVWATRPGSLGHARVRRFPKLAGSDIRDRAMNRQNPCYQAVPVRALHQLVELMNLTGQALAAIDVPTLVIHARHDHTVPHACADRIVAQIGRDRVTSLSLARSFHLVSLDVERDQVAGAVADFFATRIGRGSGPDVSKPEA